MKEPHIKRRFVPRNLMIFMMVLSLALVIASNVFLLAGLSETQRGVRERYIPLQRTSGALALFNERIHSCVIMAVHTGDLRWAEEHARLEPDLKNAIDLTRQKSPEHLDNFAELTGALAERMNAIEEEIFEHVRAGRLEEADRLLAGGEYQRLRSGYNRSIKRLSDTINIQVETSMDALGSNIQRSGVMVGLISLGLLLLWLWAIRGARRYSRERESHEAALRESERRFRDLVENIPVGIYRVTPGRDGRFVAVNPSMARMLGYESMEDLLGTEVEAHYANQEEREDLARRLREKGSVVGAEIQLIRKDGRLIWGRISANAVRDENGRILYVDGIDEDMTERKMSEVALQVSEERYRVLAENSRDLIITLDLNLRPTYVSPSVEPVRGYTVEETMVQTIDEILTHESVEHARRVLAEEIRHERSGGAVRDPGRTRTVELEMRCKDGSTMWTETKISFVRDSGGRAIGIQGSARDIGKRRIAEEALRKSEELYRGIVETAEEGIWIIDLNYRTTFVNQKLCQVLGYTAREMMGRSLLEFLDPGTREEIQRRGGLEDTETTEHTDMRLIHRDGSDVWVILSSNPIFDREGLESGTLVMMTPITDRKRAEDGSRMLANVSSLFLGGRDIDRAINTVLRMCGEFDNADRAWVFMISEDRRTVSNTHEWCGPGIESWKSRLQAVPVSELQWAMDQLSEGRSLVIPDVRGVPGEYGAWLERQNVSSLIIFPIFIDGRFDGFSGFDAIGTQRVWKPSDVSVLRQTGELIARGIERNRAESKVRNSQALYTSLVEHLVQCVFRKDREGRFTFANSNFCTLVGKPLEEILWKTDFDILPEEYARAYHEDDQRVMGDGEVVEREEENINAEGQTIFMHVVKTPIRNVNGEVVGMQGIAWDVTSHRQAEEAMRKASRMEATATLAGGIAHDFNNLMVGILGNADLLKLKFADQPDLIRRIDVIATGARRGGDLARQMLNFAQGGRISTELMNLADTVRETLQLQERVFRSEIAVQCYIEPDLWEVHADPTQMGQVVMNLCINAVEAITGEGRIEITLRNLDLKEVDPARHENLKPGPHVELRISDTGCGMDAETVRRVFEPFFTTKFQGRGLGLASIYGIIQNHAGWISVTSQPGAGTTFEVLLPAAVRSGRLTRSRAMHTPTGFERILLIEGEDVVRETAEMMMRDLGYHVKAVVAPREALDYLSDEDRLVDLVIIDEALLEGGTTLPGAFGAGRPGLRVVVCSGRNDPGSRAEFLRRGSVGCVQKPLQLEQLSREIRTALSGEGIA